MTKEIRFNAFAMNCTGHMAPGLWRHPKDHSDRYVDLKHWTDLAECVFIFVNVASNDRQFFHLAPPCWSSLIAASAAVGDA